MISLRRGTAFIPFIMDTVDSSYFSVKVANHSAYPVLSQALIQITDGIGFGCGGIRNRRFSTSCVYE